MTGTPNVPRNASNHPTDTVVALACWVVGTVTGRYLRCTGTLAS